MLIRKVEIENDEVRCELLVHLARLTRCQRHTDDLEAIAPLDELSMEISDPEVVLDDEHRDHGINDSVDSNAWGKITVKTVPFSLAISIDPPRVATESLTSDSPIPA